jgi:hypothetical protein
MDEPEKTNSQPIFSRRPNKMFSRRSDTESVCTVCFASIRTERATVLEVAENIHADVCLVRPDAFVRYMLL